MGESDTLYLYHCIHTIILDCYGGVRHPLLVSLHMYNTGLLWGSHMGATLASDTLYLYHCICIILDCYGGVTWEPPSHQTPSTCIIAYIILDCYGGVRHPLLVSLHTYNNTGLLWGSRHPLLVSYIQ